MTIAKIVVVALLGICVILIGSCAVECLSYDSSIPDSIELMNGGTITSLIWCDTPFSSPAKTLHLSVDGGRDINMLDWQGDLQTLKIGQKVYLYRIYNGSRKHMDYISTTLLDLNEPPWDQYQLTVGGQTKYNCLYGKGDCEW